MPAHDRSKRWMTSRIKKTAVVLLQLTAPVRKSKSQKLPLQRRKSNKNA